MIRALAKFLTLFALLTSPVLGQGAPAQWNYSWQNNNAQALYPGQVSIPQLGTQNCIGSSSGVLGTGSCVSGGNIGAGHVLANAGANPAPATDTSATSWFDQAYCNTVGYLIARFASEWTCAPDIPVRITWLGADPTGVTPADGIIQSEINLLGANGGGDIAFDPGVYNISHTLLDGNGTSSSISTIYNVRLSGLADPKTSEIFPGFPTQDGGVTLKWTGGIGDVIQVAGPLQGWGLDHLYIDCNNSATVGIDVISAEFGNSSNVTVANCSYAGVYSQTYAHFGSLTFTDSYKNSWYNLVVIVPNIDGAKGVFLTSGSGVTDSDTDYNSFYNLQTLQLGTASTVGLILQAADSNTFYFYSPQIQGYQQQTEFDYSVNGGVWPSANHFFGSEPGSPINIGTPSANARPNNFYGILEANGNPYPTSLANADSGLPLVIGGGINLAGQTTAISQTNLAANPIYASGLYRIDYYIGITTAGSAGTLAPAFFWSDGTAQVFSTPGIDATSINSFVNGSLIVYAIAGTNVSYQVGASGLSGSPKYQVKITMERLN